MTAPDRNVVAVRAWSSPNPNDAGDRSAEDQEARWAQQISDHERMNAGYAALHPPKGPPVAVRVGTVDALYWLPQHVEGARDGDE